MSKERDYLLREGIIQPNSDPLSANATLTAVDADEAVFVMQCYFPRHFTAYKAYWLPETTRRRIEAYMNSGCTSSKRQKVDFHENKNSSHDRAVCSSSLCETSSYNRSVNRLRKENCVNGVLDLQTMVVHRPKGRMTSRRVFKSSQISFSSQNNKSFPLSLTSKQYQPAISTRPASELKYLPLGTVDRSVPAVELLDSKEDPDFPSSVVSDGGENDRELSSDSGCLSDEEKEKVQTGLKCNQSTTAKEADAKKDVQLLLSDQPQLGELCAACYGDSDNNQLSVPESLVRCTTCKSDYHLSCLKLKPDLRNHFGTTGWTCFKCKSCPQCEKNVTITECSETHFENQSVFRCCNCDNLYHVNCLSNAKSENRFDSLKPVGRWACPKCGNCASCLTRWSFEWKMEFTQPVEMSHFPKFLQTHCLDCSNKFRRGLFCSVCLKVFNTEKKMLVSSTLQCGRCFLLVHMECDARIPKENLLEILSTRFYICRICRGEAPNVLGSYVKEAEKLDSPNL
ncbi:PHD finger protein 10-like isoform X3 [Convolutriloba macropyga]